MYSFDTHAIFEINKQKYGFIFAPYPQIYECYNSEIQTIKTSSPNKKKRLSNYYYC